MEALADECLFPEVDKLLLALYEHTVFWYIGRMEINEEIWIAACAHELQRRWRTVEPMHLEELAADLWRVAGSRGEPVGVEDRRTNTAVDYADKCGVAVSTQTY